MFRAGRDSENGADLGSKNGTYPCVGGEGGGDLGGAGEVQWSAATMYEFGSKRLRDGYRMCCYCSTGVVSSNMPIDGTLAP